MGKKLAIRGHSTRGKEVIKLLEMMGGSNIHQYNGEANSYSYYISGNVILNDRLSIIEDDDFEIFNLEEFLEKFPFKVHDLVNIPEYESTVGICGMRWDKTCRDVEYLVYRCDDEEWYTTKELLEYNDNPNETTDCKKCGLHFGSVQCFDKDCPNNTPKSVEKEAVFTIGHVMVLDKVDDKLECAIIDGYEFDKIENGKIILKPIKPKYPKNYKECCDVLKIPNDERYIDIDVPLDYNKLVSTFTELLICRKAYWKIAGEQMGLDKPWEPDWNDSKPKYTIVVIENKLAVRHALTQSFILAFPTEEMRDAFYENFKKEIEQCKELL